MIIILFISFVLSLIGMIIDRVLLLKFFLCYEFSFLISVLILVLYSNALLATILILYFIWNSMFEVLLGLNGLLL